MLKRKATVAKSAPSNKRSSRPKVSQAKTPPVRRRFVISSKAMKPGTTVAKPVVGNKVQPPAASASPKLPTKPPANSLSSVQTPVASGVTAIDLTETIKTLVHLGQEHGYVTYDDINDILTDNLSPEDLDALLTKLRGLDVEIVMDQGEADSAERKQPEQAQQEVEICKKIEEAEIAMKAIIYGLGFTAKEHIAIAEKLLSEPPKERFDRVIIDKKIANREGHLKDLRKRIKKIHAADQKVDAKYFVWQKAQQKGRKEALSRELKKMGAKLQELFVKFYFKQKVVEEMIVVAVNIHEKFQASLRHLQELETQRNTAERRAAAEAEQHKIQT